MSLNFDITGDEGNGGDERARPEQCIEKMEGLFKTGITHFVTGSSLGPNVRGAINLFGLEVLPHFKSE